MEAERLRGLEVNGQFELRWLLNGKIGRLGSLQDAIDIGSRAPEIVVDIGSIRHQGALRDGCPKEVNGRQSVLLRQPDEQMLMDNYECVRRNDQPAARLASKFDNSLFDFGGVANRGRRYLDPPPLKWSDLKYVFGIKEDRYAKEEIQA